MWPVLYIHITIVNDDSIVVRMMVKVVASPMIVILTTLEAPTIVILTTRYNIYGTGITYDGRNILIVLANGLFCPLRVF